MDLFSPDSAFMNFLNRVGEMILLSVLWLVCCIPIVTIGCSTTAEYYAAMKALKGEGHVSSNFFKSFRLNWKQAVVSELILLVLAFILYIDLFFCFAIEGLLASVLLIVFFFLAILMFITITYLFPILSRFETGLWQLFKRSLLIAWSNFGWTILVCLVNLLPLLVFLFKTQWFFRLLPVFLLIYPGAGAFVNSLIFLRVFRKYTPKEVLEEENAWRRE